MNPDAALEALVSRLLDARSAAGHWEGRLSSSALSTATAAIALATVGDRACAGRGLAWLATHQNADGGWGDTPASRSNISTTALAWAALSLAESAEENFAAASARATTWLAAAAGSTAPAALRDAILQRYGADRTFSVPILMALSVTGTFGAGAAPWREVPQLPFELAALPHRWFQYLQLPVVSYALPALIAIGQVRHHFAPTRNPILRLLRRSVRDRTHASLRSMQPGSGGYLEATPLTSFVVMSLAAMGRTDSPVVEHGVRFLRDSMRADGSWPIDTHLATWVTTTAVRVLAEARALERTDRAAASAWLLAQQTASEHPFTHAAPGGWAWTPLSGGVPDADDTAGALVALRALGGGDERTRQACVRGASWLLGVQNRDGGIPTFCRGWGTLPFDRSTPEITAHALEAWSAAIDWLPPALAARVRDASARAAAYISRAQRPDGSWVPLWFGNERSPREENPTYGTARVLLGLDSDLGGAAASSTDCRRRGLAWLLEAQNADGGWGGDRDVRSSIEETGLALAALCHGGRKADVTGATDRAAQWLARAAAGAIDPAPIGLYFANLWYSEDLYPLLFATLGLAAYRRVD